MRIDNPSILGSLQLQDNSRSDLSGSFTGSFLGTLDGTAATASYVQGTAVEGFTAFSSSAAGRISDLETDSGSFSTRVSTNETNISTLTSQTSSYLLNTTDTLTGDLTVTGKITAQEFHTEFVSASIIYQSGSTKFGDTFDDIHSFTGSVSITGSGTFSNYGPAYFMQGNVGIGTTNPSSKLEINPSSGDADLILSSNGTQTLRLDQNSIRTTTTNNLALFTNGNTNQLVLGSTGNVGIGTTSSNAAKLRIRKDSDTDYTVTGFVSTAPSAILYNGTSGALNYASLSFLTEANGEFAIGSVQNVGNTASDFVFVGRNGASRAEHLRITSGGNVGIGTTGPSDKLHLFNSSASTGLRIESTATNGEPSINFYGKNSGGTVRSFVVKYDNIDIVRIGTASAIDMRFETSDQERMRILAGGNVGIGTTSPSYKLDVSGAIQSSVASGNGSLYINNSSLSGKFWAVIPNTSSTESDLLFYYGGTGAGTRLTLTNSGNVGIGNATPASLLDVSGDVTLQQAADLKWMNTARDTTYGVIEGLAAATVFKHGATETMRIDSSGNVGIGTTSPNAKLQVNGMTSVNDNYFILSANASTAQSNTHTITIPFTSQGSQYGAFIVEVIYASSWTDANSTFSGRATYALSTATTIYDITELEDIGADVSFAATVSGMNFIITATSTASAGQEPNRIGAVVRITRGNNAVSNRPTGITLT